MDENDQLNQLLENNDPTFDTLGQKLEQAKADAPAPSRVVVYQSGINFCQWSMEPNDIFRASGPRVQTLPTGVYAVDADDRGLYYRKMNVLTDNLIELDDSPSQRVISTIGVFWKSRHEYVKRGVVYKRGILLWGPAGSGKTATLALLMKDLLSAGGLCFICQHPAVMTAALAILRRVEESRNIIIVMEDIDEMIQRYSEHDVLALLDGETQIDNVVHIATTNYPERLGARIVNRPSRFDERIFIGMPGDKAREKYLRHITAKEEISESELMRWVGDTKDFSIAHLRELAIAVFCLKQPYEDVLTRLAKMRVQPKAKDEFAKAGMGLAPQQDQAWTFAYKVGK